METNFETELLNPRKMACKIVITNIDDVNGAVSFNFEQFIRIDYTDCKFLIETLEIPSGTVYHAIKEDSLDQSIIEQYKELTPKMVIIDELETDLVSESCFCSTATKSLIMHRVYKVVMEQKMELRRFPFDRQLVEIKMRTYKCYYSPWPVEDRADAPIRWVKDPEWRRSEVIAEYHAEDWKVKTMDTYFQRESNISNFYVIDIGIERDATYYLNNCGLVVFIIVQVASFVVVIDPSDFPSRSSITITLLLTIVAFKFVADGFIPKVNYLTFLDKYIAIGFVALMLEIAENFCITLVSDYRYPLGAFYFDIVFNCLFAAVWIIGHIYIVHAAYRNKFSIPWGELIRQRDELLRVSCSVVRSACVRRKRDMPEQ